jgi:hypothetical protein
MHWFRAEFVYEETSSTNQSSPDQVVNYRRADNSRPVPFTVTAWEWAYATNLSRLQRERERQANGMWEKHY